MLKRDTFLERDIVMNVLMTIDNWDGQVPMPAILKPRPLWTGKQVYTLIIPNVNYRVLKGGDADNDPTFKKDDAARAGADFKLWPADNTVLVQRGQLLMGNLDKGPLGNRAQSI